VLGLLDLSCEPRKPPWSSLSSVSLLTYLVRNSSQRPCRCRGFQ
jgi:hypothetical protein